MQASSHDLTKVTDLKQLKETAIEVPISIYGSVIFSLSCENHVSPVFSFLIMHFSDQIVFYMVYLASERGEFSQPMNELCL